MSAMRDALIRAGLASEADVKRIEAESAAQAAVAEELARRARALAKLPSQVVAELLAWQRATKRYVPTPVVVEWSLLAYDGQLREWARWLAAAREEKVS